MSIYQAIMEVFSALEIETSIAGEADGIKYLYVVEADMTLMFTPGGNYLNITRGRVT